MKVILLTLFSIILIFSNSKSQEIQKAAQMQNACLSQQKKSEIYTALRDFIFKNAKPEQFAEAILESGETQLYHTGISLKYDGINFTHKYVTNNNIQSHPNFNIETIEVSAERIYYTLIYGSHLGDSSVSIEIKNYPEKQAKIIQKKVDQHFCGVLEKMNFNLRISGKEAINIATEDANGFLSTWIDAPKLDKNNWHISTTSKSAKPPMYSIIDANTGAILLKLDNSNDPKQKEKLKSFLKEVDKKNSIMENDAACFSEENFDKVYKYLSSQIKNNSFYPFEGYELYLQSDRINFKKDNFTISVIDKEKGIFSLSKFSKSNKKMVEKTNSLFCKLITQSEIIIN